MTPSGPRWTGKLRFVEKHLEDPIRWQKPRRIFVNSMSDLFHERVPLDWIQRAFDVMLRVDRHVYQVLTKRHERLAQVLPRVRLLDGRQWNAEPPSHVWVGVSVENQDYAERRIPALAATPAAVRFLSVEPLLGPVSLKGLLGGIHWVIVGEESGPGARPMNLDWVRSLRDQCVAAGVSFFFKQAKVGVGGRMVGLPALDGKRWAEYPDVKPPHRKEVR
jgi:protein gp37